MCFQGFAHYGCGHTAILETECELADDHALYLKVACPNYRIESRKQPKACGVGGFYCKETEDGPFLDKVHQNLIFAQRQLASTEVRLQKVNAAQAAFNRCANDNGVSVELRVKYPSYHRLYTNQQQLLNERSMANEIVRRSMLTIQEAKNFYARRAQRILAGTAPQDLPENFADAIRTQHAMVTARTIDVSENRLPHSSQLPHAAPTNAAAGPSLNNRGRQRRAILQETVSRPAAPRPEPASPRKPVIQQQSSNVRRSARVRDKKVSYAESDASSIASREPSPDKSDISGFSPSKSDITDSPDKHNRSLRGESIEIKRETSELHRSSSSLGNRIGDWRQRNKRSLPMNAAQMPQTPAQATTLHLESTISPPKLNDPAQANAKAPSLAEILRRELQQDSLGTSHPLEHIPNTHSDARPPTRHGVPMHQLYTGEMGKIAVPQPPAIPNFLSDVPVQNMNLNLFHAYAQGSKTAKNISCEPFHGEQQPSTMPSQTEGHRNWLINTPALEFLSNLAPGASNVGIPEQSNHDLPMERDDSIFGNTALADFDFKPDQASAYPNYEHMRRSFSEAANLTPPAVNVDTMTDTDPKKRKLPASSPSASPSKRMRLSLPGENQASSVYGESAAYGDVWSRSSPSKMPSQMLLAGNDEGALQSTPAPILAPTAIMYAPSKQEWITGEDAGPADAELPGETSAGAVNTDDVGYQFSDNVWEELMHGYDA